MSVLVNNTKSLVRFIFSTPHQEEEGTPQGKRGEEYKRIHKHQRNSSCDLPLPPYETYTGRQSIGDILLASSSRAMSPRSPR